MNENVIVDCDDVCIDILEIIDAPPFTDTLFRNK